MDKINFLFFRSDMQAQGEEGNALIMKFLQKSGQIIEQEVNEAGGIAGKPIKTCAKVGFFVEFKLDIIHI